MRSLITAIIFLVFLFFSSEARSQEPDIREIRPAVMILVDTSGSMNYDVASPASRPFGPTCPGNPGRPSTRSKWIALLETLTGTFDNYYCTAVNRRTAYRGEPDQYYSMPHYLPSGNQRADGILDVYRDRVKFGLMTMDPVYGLEELGSSGTFYYLPASTYWARLSAVTGAPGDYSYGSARPVSWPGCTGEFISNGGARRANRTSESIPGALISVGNDSADHLVTNAQVQSSLLTVRPYGGSPIDALVQDFEEWADLDEDIAVGSDPYAACRDRFAILISDGEGDDFYRRIGCEAPGERCPYSREVDTVRRLCQFDGEKCQGLIDGFYAVGYDVSSAAGLANLNMLAVAGGTGSVYTADSAVSLIASLSRVLDRAATGTTTRTTPAYAKGESPASSQYEFTSGFQVGTRTRPWVGILERARYTCTSPELPAAKQALGAGDRFHEVLNARDLTANPRSLFTAGVGSSGAAQGVVIAPVDPLLALPTSPTRGSARTALAPQGAVSAQPTGVFGFSTGTVAEREAQRAALMGWLTGASRPGARLGDIYHSSPAVITRPRVDIADESYNAFRQRAGVVDRPVVLYVGTNDGIMHAFSAEDHTLPSGRVVPSGEELWGFVPPAVLPKLSGASVSHQFLVDGTPIVRDLFMRRLPGAAPNASNYRTVMVAGLRGGGPHYFALDVSDPLNPRFMWQFTRPEMGPAVGRPALAQVLARIDGVLQERAVAIFGAGAGELVISGPGRGWGACAVPPGAARRGVTTAPGRTQRRCWLGEQGRALYVVDIATGEVLREWVGGDIAAPMTGGVSAFTGEVGTIATRAYTVDSDGVLWRMDISSPDPALWGLEAVHDLYWADGALDGADSQEGPMLSTDGYGRVVVVVGTGNMDDLEGTDLYRVASITDGFALASDGTVAYSPGLNWEVRLRPGEQVVGPMELFNSQVYFSTFASVPPSRDMCSWGGGRLWGVGYLTTGPVPTGYASSSIPFPSPGMTALSGAQVHWQDTDPNKIAVGVSIRQTPTCVSGLSETDPYSAGTRFRVGAVGGGEFRLVAQASGSNSSRTAPTSIEVISRDLPPPSSLTSVLAWGQVD